MLKLFGGELADLLSAVRATLSDDDLKLVTIEPTARYARIERIVARCLAAPADRPAGRTGSDRLDAVLTHPVIGGAIFLAVMSGMFMAIFLGADPLMGGIESLFGSFSRLAAANNPEGALQSLVCDGLIAGVGAVVVFLPQIVILFALIAVLEDCGYMSRAAFLLDRTMSRCGLSGRSFVPLLSSFACAVPGIMAARVIENRRDRIATILVAPLISCSARLPVYVVLVGVLLPSENWALRGLTLLAVYAIGPVLAVLFARLFKRTVLRGDTPAFVMEMPSFKWPTVRLVALRAYTGGRSFLVRAGTVIFAATLIVWALSYYPRPADRAQRYEQLREQAAGTLAGEALDAELEKLDALQAGENVRESYLGRAGRIIEPAVRPLGWDWRVGTAALACFPAREVLVSTLGTI
jgi:ferrous iron transport protein B